MTTVLPCDLDEMAEDFVIDDDGAIVGITTAALKAVHGLVKIHTGAALLGGRDTVVVGGLSGSVLEMELLADLLGEVIADAPGEVVPDPPRRVVDAAWEVFRWTA